MGQNYSKTHERLLVIGCTGFAGFGSISWTDQVVPNIPDYDRVIVSVAHIAKELPT